MKLRRALCWHPAGYSHTLRVLTARRSTFISRARPQCPSPTWSHGCCCRRPSWRPSAATQQLLALLCGPACCAICPTRLLSPRLWARSFACGRTAQECRHPRLATCLPALPPRFPFRRRLRSRRCHPKQALQSASSSAASRLQRCSSHWPFAGMLVFRWERLGAAVSRAARAALCAAAASARRMRTKRSAAARSACASRRSWPSRVC